MRKLQLVKNILKKNDILKSIFRFFKLRQMSKFPMQIQIETTSVCNSRCIMCPHKNMARSKKHMEFDLFKKIIDDCARHKKYVKNVSLFFMGEPFLAPRIFDEIEYAKTRGIKSLYLVSNGSVLTEDKSRKLLKSGLDNIIFSVDGATKEVFERIRVGLNFDDVVRNITTLVNLKKETKSKKPQIMIEMVVSPHVTDEEVKSFHAQWDKVVDGVICRKLYNFSGMDIDYIVNDDKKHYPCPYLWKNLEILQDGKAVLCCVDSEGSHAIGDVSQQSISDIWHGESLMNYRSLHLSGRNKDIQLCSSCDFYKTKNKPWWWYD